MRPLLPFIDVSEQSCVHSDIRLQNGDEIAHVPRLVDTIKISVPFTVDLVTFQSKEYIFVEGIKVDSGIWKTD